MPELRSVRVAAIQATPVVLDAEATIAKTVELFEQAAAQGVELAVLPETFVPVYPSNRWAKGAADFGGWDEFWERLHANSVEVPGPLVDELVAACERLRPARRGRDQRARRRLALQRLPACSGRPGSCTSTAS